MKKILYILIFLFRLNAPLSAQWINSIYYQPSNPSTTDSITFYVSLSFPTGTCDQHAQGYNLNGNKVEAFALHCLGMLTYICNHTDTFKLNPLPAGTYSFRFQLDVGMLPFPCSPGIIPGPADSLNFVVNPVTAIHEIMQETVNVILIGDDLMAESHHQNDFQLTVFDMSGKQIIAIATSRGLLKLSIAELGKGMYRYAVSSGNKILKEGSFARL